MKIVITDIADFTIPLIKQSDISNLGEYVVISEKNINLPKIKLYSTKEKMRASEFYFQVKEKNVLDIHHLDFLYENQASVPTDWQKLKTIPFWGTVFQDLVKLKHRGPGDHTLFVRCLQFISFLNDGQGGFQKCFCWFDGEYTQLNALVKY